MPQRHDPLDHRQVDADLAGGAGPDRKRDSLLSRIFGKVAMILVFAIIVSAAIAVLAWLWRGIIGA